MSQLGLCSIIAIALSIALIVKGFMEILKLQLPGETDAQVIQRQLRGFAHLLLSQIVLVLGLSLCIGLNMDSVQKAIRAARI